MAPRRPYGVRSGSGVEPVELAEAPAVAGLDVDHNRGNEPGRLGIACRRGCPMTAHVVERPFPELVRVDLGWWKCADYDLVQVVSPRTTLGTAWIVWRGDHVLHTTNTLPDAGDWVVTQIDGGAPR